MAVSEAYFTTCLIGEKGCGKTSFAIGDAAHGVPSSILEHCKTWNMKALFVDNWRDRPGYEKIPLITFDELKENRFKRGGARIIVDRETRDEIPGFIYKHMRETVCCFEDSKMLVPANIVGTEWEDLLISNKNIKCSLIFMYHGFTGISPKMYQYVDELEIFKTKQHPQARKSDILKYDEVLETWTRVMKHKNPFYHETVNNGS